ncbi:UNVERIFIED_CONTAM: hypothetical protein HDU68_010080 [Siphonaria sp. JEL0065]|nr:hypothetical protein HDU68_010080 [Siphonaria sp. JEL0065]
MSGIAFTAYYSSAGCTGLAIKIAYNETVTGCAPLAEVSTCLPSPQSPKWFARTGCLAADALSYTTLGNTYLGSGMQLQYTRNNNDSATCAGSLPGSFQYSLDTCIPNIEGKMYNNKSFKTEVASIIEPFNSPSNVAFAFTNSDCNITRLRLSVKRHQPTTTTALTIKSSITMVGTKTAFTLEVTVAALLQFTLGGLLKLHASLLSVRPHPRFPARVLQITLPKPGPIPVSVPFRNST